MPTANHSAESDIPSATRAPRQRRKEARPSELSAAALDLFVEKGFAATRLEDVAARAGVSKGTLYLYFDSKEALFKAVVEEGIVPLMLRAEQLMEDFQGTSVDSLRFLLASWWEQIGATRLAGIPKLIVSESRNFPELAQFYHDQVLVRGRGLMRRVLERSMASGEFREMNVDTAIDVIFAPLMMLVIWRFSLHFCGHENDPEVFLKTHFDFLVHGLCAQKELKEV